MNDPRTVLRTALACSALVACDSVAAPDVPTDAPTDTAPPCVPSAELDLLFVIDDSISTLGIHTRLGAELLTMLTTLTELASLHVGVVSTDLGGGPHGEISRCPAGFGDDGILRNTTSAFGCEPTYPSRIFEVPRGAPSTDVAADLRCVAQVGTDGCGFQQQLEAGLKALSPTTANEAVSSDYAPPTFAEGGVGHGDGENAGFLRVGSVLAVVVLTDEDDCSMPTYALLDPSRDFGSLSFRCIRHPEELYPVQRYVDGFLQLRQDRRRLVFVPIVGVPPDVTGASYDDILLDPRMQSFDPLTGEVSRTCDGATSIAYPPRRFVELARSLAAAGTRTAMASICDSDGSRWRVAVVEQVSAALSCSPP